MSLLIGPNQIYLWIVFLDQEFDPRLLDRYQDLLSIAENSRMRRYAFAKDKRRFLVTRALVRTVLSRYSPIKPKDWIFTTTPSGKPIIANKNFDSNTISFNISHTDDLIVLGITNGHALGVDVENRYKNNVKPLDIAEQYFSNEEVVSLQFLSANNQLELFFRYWTLKESYIKARGIGISIPLNSFSFHLQEDLRLNCSMRPQLNDCSSFWKFLQLQPTQKHIISICVSHYSNSEYMVKLRKVIPLKSEEEMDGVVFISS